MYTSKDYPLGSYFYAKETFSAVSFVGMLRELDLAEVFEDVECTRFLVIPFNNEYISGVEFKKDNDSDEYFRSIYTKDHGGIPADILAEYEQIYNDTCNYFDNLYLGKGDNDK